MPFTFAVLALAVAVGYARGGRLLRITDHPLRRSWLLIGGVLLQAAVDVVAGRSWAPSAVTTIALLASQVLVLAWVWWNRDVPGVVVIAVGFALNLLVITANGAMPVDPAAIADAGLPVEGLPPGKHELLTSDTRLQVLADVLPVAPLRTIVSLGDVILAGGILLVVQHLMTSPPRDQEPAAVAP